MVSSSERTYIHVLCSRVVTYVHTVYVHVRIKIGITLDRNEIWAQGLYHSTALIEAAKSLAPFNVKAHGKVPYQKLQLKSMAHSVQYIYV